MHDAGRPGTELRFTLPIPGTHPAGTEPATEGGLAGRLEAGAEAPASMGAAHGRASGADVLCGADARAVALAPLVPASTGAALTIAPAWLPDMRTPEVRSRPFCQSEAGHHGTEAAGGQQPQREAAGSSPMKSTSEVVKPISVHLKLRCDAVRMDEDVPISLALPVAISRRSVNSGSWQIATRGRIAHGFYRDGH
jgi:hypothetical protein